MTTKTKAKIARKSKTARLLVSASCSNEFNDGAPSYALLELSRTNIQELLRRLQTSKELKKRDQSFAKATYWSGYCGWLGYWEGIDQLPQDSLKQLNDGCPVLLPDGVAVPEDAYKSTECDMMLVWPEEVCFSACPKHTSDRVETSEVSEKFLRELEIRC